MLNRSLSYVIKDQIPVTLSPEDSVKQACHEMRERRIGAVLVVDDEQKLVGIFTRCDALSLIDEGKNVAAITLREAMTPDPDTIHPTLTVIDALRIMDDCGYKHLPIVEEDRVLGIVSYSDFKGDELVHLEQEKRLWECI